MIWVGWSNQIGLLYFGRNYNETFFKNGLCCRFQCWVGRPVHRAAECIAPANPGGGWDFTCRSITKIMHDIGAVDSPLQVTNMAGGGGGLAFTHVVNCLLYTSPSPRDS